MAEEMPPTSRVYRIKWWLRAFSVGFLVLALLFTFAIARQIFLGEQDFSAKAVFLGTILMAVAMFLVLASLTSSVKLDSASISVESFFITKKLCLSQIRGRRSFVVRDSDGSTRYLRLEANDDPAAALTLTENYNFDANFYRWFNSLPDLDELDQAKKKTSNIGLV